MSDIHDVSQSLASCLREVRLTSNAEENPRSLGASVSPFCLKSLLVSANLLLSFTIRDRSQIDHI